MKRKGHEEIAAQMVLFQIICHKSFVWLWFFQVPAMICWNQKPEKQKANRNTQNYIRLLNIIILSVFCHEFAMAPWRTVWILVKNSSSWVSLASSMLMDLPARRMWQLHHWAEWRQWSEPYEFRGWEIAFGLNMWLCACLILISLIDWDFLAFRVHFVVLSGRGGYIALNCGVCVAGAEKSALETVWKWFASLRKMSGEDWNHGMLHMGGFQDLTRP